MAQRPQSASLLRAGVCEVRTGRNTECNPVIHLLTIATKLNMHVTGIA
jgi:hypothetical protein